MASFQAKIGWKRPQSGEIKIMVPIASDPTRNREFQKNRKKITNIKKPRYGFFSSQNRLERPRKRENKHYRSDPFQPNALQKFEKK